jgi:uncharacterized membrane protein YdjX (TVP38/TMEM64 family)
MAVSRRWVPLAGLAVLLAVAGGGLWLWRQPELRRLFMDRAALESYLDGLGHWAAVAIVAAEIVQVIFSFVPGQIVGLAAGYLYGPWWGGLLCLLGLGIGTVSATYLGRVLGRPVVERMLGPEVLAQLARFAERGRLAIFLIFLFPFLPDDAVCFVAGLLPYSLAEMFILALIGRAPGVWVSAWVGAQAEQLTLAHMAVVSGIGLLLALAAWRFQRPLEAAMFRVIGRAGRWFHHRGR